VAEHGETYIIPHNKVNGERKEGGDRVNTCERTREGEELMRRKESREEVRRCAGEEESRGGAKGMNRRK
jgi:hypothetical protein